MLSMLREPSLSCFNASMRYFRPASVFFLTLILCAVFLAYSSHNVIFFPLVSIPSSKSRCISRSFSLRDKSSRFPFGTLSVATSFHEYTTFVSPARLTYLYIYLPSALWLSPVLKMRPLLSRLFSDIFQNSFQN